METGKNYYEKKAKKRGFLGEITKEMDTDESMKNSAIETGKDLLVGAVGGGIVGAMLGKFSLLAGTGVTFLSHYYKKHVGQLGRAFGIAMMSSGSFEALPKQTVSGTEDKEQGVIEGITERIMTFKDDISKRFFLDKILAKKEATDKKTEKKTDTTKKVTTPPTTAIPESTASSETEETEKPVGEVQYFLYPGATKGKEAELSDLDHFEDGLHESAAEFKKNNGTEGLGEEMEEMDGTDELDPTEKNY
jgi:hypothetical protein